MHCAGGKGRAGTFVACWLVVFGFAGPSEDWQYPAMSASEAIAHLRRIRPGSIESHDQEELVSPKSTGSSSLLICSPSR